MRVHATEDLEALLGDAITARTQLRRWPLSLVELLETASGCRVVYKAQRLLTVEPRIYDAARGRTSLLPSCRVLTDDGESSTMLIEHLDRPFDVIDVDAAREVVAAINALPTDLPTYVDISSPDRWYELVDQALTDWSRLVADGRFTRTTPSDIERIGAWARSPEVRAAIDTEPRITNGDLKRDHVFAADDGFRIIDWSSPVLGPPELDLVMLLEDVGIDPRPHVDAAVVGIRWFQHLRWAVVSKTSLLPDMPVMFDDWAAGAVQLIDVRR